MKVLSIFCGAGLMDRAFLDEGFTVIPGCEIDPEQRDTYYKLNGKKPLFHSFEEMDIACDKYELVIGGPPCQSLSRTKRDMKPKFKDFTEELLAWGTPKNYLYENVKPLKIPGSNSYLCDAMHYAKPHQSRPRWFTTNIESYPIPKYNGTSDSLLAYPVVAGRLYGPQRGAVLQGYPDFYKLDCSCRAKQKGLAMGVHYEVARAWAKHLAYVFKRNGKRKDGRKVV